MKHRKTTKFLERCLVFILKKLGTDFMAHAYIQKGLGGWSDFENTGEELVLSKIKDSLKQETYMLFDVGANDGTYCMMLKKIFPNSRVYAFEPVNSTYEIAKKTTEALESTQILNMAASSTSGTLKLYNDSNNPNDQISTAYPAGLEDFYNVKNLTEIEVPAITLDQFCEMNSITVIDFLKIDVEGAELSVLEGCKKLIGNNALKCVQFEFNDFNIISRTFIKDFYNLLNDYKFYRISKKGILPLNDYTPDHEIFRYQNILAVSNSIDFKQ